MNIRIQKWQNIYNHCEHNRIMLNAFLDFKQQLKYCNWENLSDITKSFRTADVITCIGRSFNRIIFNIGGNKYRLICGCRFGKRFVVLYVRFVGTHEEYDKVNPCEINMF